MERLFKFILSGCFHEWEIVKECELTSKTTYLSGGSSSIKGYGYILKCKKCGELKSKDFWC